MKTISTLILPHVAEWAVPTLPRKGVHVTDLLRQGRELSQHKKPTVETGAKGWAYVGWLWERLVMDWYRWHMPDTVIEAPCSLTLDGIEGTLDGLAFQGDQYAVIECKVRFACPHSPDARSDWMEQVKAYAWMAKVTRATMPVLFLPPPPGEPQAVEYRLTFSEQELAENWAMVLSSKKFLETEA